MHACSDPLCPVTLATAAAQTVHESMRRHLDAGGGMRTIVSAATAAAEALAALRVLTRVCLAGQPRGEAIVLAAAVTAAAILLRAIRVEATPSWGQCTEGEA